MPRPDRPIDLHCDWILQYAEETTVFDPALYEGVKARVPQSEGYLTGTSAAVLSCYRRVADWARQDEPWKALAEIITRYEAEFSGRLLLGPDDHARWQDEDDLCWGVLGVEGFDRLVRAPADLPRLATLFERGVRVFQPVYSAENALGGSSADGDVRGLTPLGHAFLETLAGLAGSKPGPLPALDLAHMNPTAAAEVLAWFETKPERTQSLIPIYSHGTVRYPGFEHPRAITLENATRLRALGGVIGFSVGPPFFTDSEEIRHAIEAVAALPFLGNPGYEGIAMGTDFLGVARTLPGLGNIEEVSHWVTATFSKEAARAILTTNALSLIGRLTGVQAHQD